MLNLDIKQTAPVVPPYEEALAALLRRFGCADRVIVASFLDTATDAFSAFAPEFPTSAGTLAVAGFYQAVRAGEPPPPMPTWRCRCRRPSGSSPSSTSGSWRWPTQPGLAVHVWTIEEEAEMERLCGLGVDGIITDRPTALAAVLDRLGCRWNPSG